METVQLQCGNCGNVMAISTAHLGGQVRCPHCLTVVQTPPQSAAAPAPAEVLPPPVEVGEVESIFAPEEPSDDLFGGGPQRPLVEMPELKPIEPARYEPAAAPAIDTVALYASTPPAPAPESPSAEHDESDLRALRRPRPVYDRSYLSLMAFIFLIPYCVLSTVIIAYLMYQLSIQKNDLDFLRDPAPTKKDKPGEVNRAKHDQPLAATQKVPFGGTITIGALEVKPVEVSLNEFGDLQLRLNVKNVSTNQAFSPMHPDFLKIGKGDKPTLPYSYIETGSGKFKRIYDEHVAFKRGGAEELTDEGGLHPSQEEEVLLTTKGNKEVIESILKSNENLTWRVQLRRGLVDFGGQKVSATAVIGVQFNAREIKKG